MWSAKGNAEHLKLLVGMASLMVTETCSTPQQRWVATLRKTHKTAQWLRILIVSCRWIYRADAMMIPNNASKSLRSAFAIVAWVCRGWSESEYRQSIPTIPFTGVDIGNSNIASIIEDRNIDHSVAALSLQGGSSKGYRMWKRFVQTDLRNHHKLARHCLWWILPTCCTVTPLPLHWPEMRKAAARRPCIFYNCWSTESFHQHHCGAQRHPSPVAQIAQSSPVNRYSWEQLNWSQTDDERWNMQHHRCNMVNCRSGSAIGSAQSCSGA